MQRFSKAANLTSFCLSDPSGNPAKCANILSTPHIKLTILVLSEASCLLDCVGWAVGVERDGAAFRGVSSAFGDAFIGVGSETFGGAFIGGVGSDGFGGAFTGVVSSDDFEGALRGDLNLSRCFDSGTGEEGADAEDV